MVVPCWTNHYERTCSGWGFAIVAIEDRYPACAFNPEIYIIIYILYILYLSYFFQLDIIGGLCWWFGFEKGTPENANTTFHFLEIQTRNPNHQLNISCSYGNRWSWLLRWASLIFRFAQNQSLKKLLKWSLKFLAKPLSKWNTSHKHP